MNPPNLSLKQALPLAEKIVEALAPYCSKIEIAGSIRRKRPVVGDIDLVCLPKWQKIPEFKEAFHRCAMQGGILLDGLVAKRCLLRKSGVQLDLWIAHAGIADLIASLPCNYGGMLLTYTGSVEFNLRGVARAKQLGKTFRPGHGVIDADGTVHSVTEEEIFAALEWDYLTPEERR